MSYYSRNSGFVIAIITVMTVSCSPAFADPIGFTAITNNNGGLGPAIQGQFSVSVSPVAGFPTRFDFTIGNAGPVASIIAQIYVDTGVGPAVVGTTGIGDNPPAVDFEFPPGGVGPANLPSQGNAIPPFSTDAFLKRRGPGGVSQGVDPGENVVWQLDFAGVFDPHTALHNNSLRFGLHVQSIAGGGSDSFVTNGQPGPDPGPGPDPDPQPIPEPTSLAVWGIVGLGFVSVYFWQRRRRYLAFVS